MSSVSTQSVCPSMIEMTAAGLEVFSRRSAMSFEAPKRWFSRVALFPGSKSHISAWLSTVGPVARG